MKLREGFIIVRDRKEVRAKKFIRITSEHKVRIEV